MSMPGQAVSKINIGELLENSTIGPLQIRVFILCMICLIMDGFDVQAMGYVAPAIVEDWGIPRRAARQCVRGRQLRRAARLARLQHGGRQGWPPAGPHRRHPLLLCHDHRHGVCPERAPIALAAVHRRDRHGLHHAERDGARRRVQSETQSRDVHDVHHRRLHRRRRARRIRRGLADPGFRLAVGVHLWRRCAVGDRTGDDLGPAGVAPVPRRQRARARDAGALA